MKEFLGAIFFAVAMSWWMVGIIVATPGWPKVYAIFPPYAWYTVVKSLIEAPKFVDRREERK